MWEATGDCLQPRTVSLLRLMTGKLGGGRGGGDVEGSCFSFPSSPSALCTVFGERGLPPRRGGGIVFFPPPKNRTSLCSNDQRDEGIILRDVSWATQDPSPAAPQAPH